MEIFQYNDVWFKPSMNTTSCYRYGQCLEYLKMYFTGYIFDTLFIYIKTLLIILKHLLENYKKSLNRHLF